MEWLLEHGLFYLALVFAALGVWLLLPRRQERPRAIGLALALSGFVILMTSLHAAGGPLPREILFWTFSGGAVLCALLMIGSHNPVYAALWFALVTLCTCGLFLLQSAPFLAAATIIVYAGAIVVTFLFVIMLAQQSGASTYDRSARSPLAASVLAFVMLGALLTTLQSWGDARPTVSGGALTPTDPTAITALPASTRNPLSRTTGGAEGTMQGLGRSLFGDYLFAVELAGTLLLIASIGAIAIAPRRARGAL